MFRLSTANLALAALPAFSQLAEQDKAKATAARTILDGWEAKAPERAERELHIVYWTPADREPAAQYRDRLSKILTDIQSLHAREMERVGFGPRTLRLAATAEGSSTAVGKLSPARLESPMARMAACKPSSKATANAPTGSVPRADDFPLNLLV